MCVHSMYISSEKMCILYRQDTSPYILFIITVGYRAHIHMYHLSSPSEDNSLSLSDINSGLAIPTKLWVSCKVTLMVEHMPTRTFKCDLATSGWPLQKSKWWVKSFLQWKQQSHPRLKSPNTYYTHRKPTNTHYTQTHTTGTHTQSSSIFFSTGIRLNALQYGELKEKLQAPLREARGVIVRQSLGDQFIAAFEKQVEQNGYYNLPSSSPVRIELPYMVGFYGYYKLCPKNWYSNYSNCSL